MKKIIAGLIGILMAVPSFGRGNLPDGYTELEWIRFTGSQYIDTGYTMNQQNNPKVELKIRDKNTVSGVSGFGAQNGNLRAILDFSNQLYCGDGNNRLAYTWPSDGRAHTLAGAYTSSSNTLTVFLDGTSVREGVQQGAFPDLPFYLGRINGGGEGTYLAGYVYYFKIYENNELVRNMIPAQYGTTVGMYDTVNNQFYASAASGTNFTAGPSVDPCRNLLDPNKLTPNAGVKIADGTVIDPGSGTSASDFIPVTAGSSYTLNINGQGTSTFGLVWYNSARAYISGVRYESEKAKTFVAPSNAAYVRFTVYPIMENPQFEQGSTATNYVPYSSQCHPVSCENMFNMSQTPTDERVNSGVWQRYNISIDTGEGTWTTRHATLTPGTYTITNSSGSTVGYYIYNGTSVTKKTDSTFTLTIPSEVWIFWATPEAAANSPEIIIKNASCGGCAGGLVTYESATGTVSQSGTPTPTSPQPISFYTRGNMVLRAVGNYKDSYDASTGKITRRVGVRVLTGDELWQMDSNQKIFYTPTDYGQKRDDGKTVMSSHFQNYSYSQAATDVTKDPCVFPSYTNATQGTVAYRYTDKANADEWKAWLRDQYAAGTPVTVYYPLKTPVEETIGTTTYCDLGIKVATRKYNASAFSAVATALESAVTNIKTVVANTLAQADAVAKLHAGKQKRPTDSCPQYRQCLLVENEDGTPSWFPIFDPFRDFVTPILANNSTIPAVDAQRRYAGDLELCSMLPQTDDEATNTGIAKCTSVANYNNNAAANPVKGGALKQTEWGYEFKAADLADNPNNDSGIVYGISKCVSTEIPAGTYAKPATSTQLNNALWDARPTTMAEADKYRRCWCKTTGIAYGGQYYETSAAPWVFNYTYGSAADCAHYCANYCARHVRNVADFRSAVLGFAAD